MKALQKIDEQKIEVLTPEEEKEFNDLETEALEISDSFLKNARRFGEILDIIKSKGYYKKYRKSTKTCYPDFNSYLKATFHRGRAMFFNYQKVAEIMNLLEEAGYDPYELRTINNALIMYKEIKGFFADTKLDKEEFEKLSKDLTLETWKLLLQTAPRDEENVPFIDQEHIQVVFGVIQDHISTNAIELDGEQFPTELAAVALDTKVTEEIYERINRQKQAILDEKLNRKRAERFLPAAIPIARSEDLENRPIVGFLCPDHGTVNGVALLRAGVLLDCGCRAINELRGDISKFVHYPGDENERS